MTPTNSSLLNIVASHTCTAYRCAALSIMIIFASCGSVSQTKDSDHDSSYINLPVGGLSASDSTRLHNSVEAWYDSALRNRGFNGGVLVAKNGHVIYEVYSGYEHVNGKDPMTDTSSMHIASVSKTFTAMAVLKLWQDGKLNIDSTYNTYFPEFNYPNITVRNLLSHRSGLPNYLYFMEELGWNKKVNITNQDVLDFMVAKKASIKNIGLPNRNFTYCNTNYALLALLIEKASGKKYADYLQETFFTPLGMKHTFVYNPTDSGKVIPSYDYRGVLIPVNFLDVVYGDKNVYSTPRDLLTWDRALSGNQIFNPATLQEAYQPYSNEKAGVRNYGLGWRMNIYSTGKKMIYHNGWWHGNNASFIRLTQDTATIIVLGNKYNRNIYHANKLSNLFGNYLGESYEEEGEAKATAPTPVPKKIRTARPAKAKTAVKTKAPTKTKASAKSTKQAPTKKPVKKGKK